MCTYIEFFYGPLGFSLRGKFIPKIRNFGDFGGCKSLKGIYPFGENLYHKLPIFAILGAVSPHLQSHNDKIWREGGDLGLPPHAKFCKNRLMGVSP